MKIKVWDGGDIQEYCLATIKRDGVQCFLKDGVVVSRKLKPLHNIPAGLLTDGVAYECFTGSFEGSVSLVKTINGSRLANRGDLYSLFPPDPRNVLLQSGGLKAAEIQKLMDYVIANGHEGLVIHTNTGLIKCKPIQTHDVVVTGVVEGMGRNLGRLGAFITDMGKVGTGFTDAQRVDFYANAMVGETIEVECMHLTCAGKFRHPRFIRHRFDK